MGSTEIFFPKKAYTFPELLNQIKKSTSLFYSFYNGYVIFQDNPPKQSFTQQAVGGKQPAGKNQFAKSNLSSPGKHPQEPKSSEANVTHFLKPAIAKDTVKGFSIQGKQKINAAPLQLSKKLTRPTSNSTSASVGKGERSVALHTGLIWNISLPLQGFSSYFTGANGSNQPYNLLIPGAWASLVFNDKSDLAIQVRLAQQIFTGNATLSSVAERVSPQDSLPSQKTLRLIKTQGPSVSLQYDYYINDRFLVGAGLKYYWINAALVSNKKNKVSNGLLIYDSTTGINKSDLDWQLLKSSFLSASVEGAYRLNNIQFGIVFILPITDISSTPINRLSLLNGQLFLRWTIWQTKSY